MEVQHDQTIESIVTDTESHDDPRNHTNALIRVLRVISWIVRVSEFVASSICDSANGEP